MDKAGSRHGLSKGKNAAAGPVLER